MPKIKVNDISMYYEEHGKGDPIVLIGGFSTDHTTWLPVVDLLKTDYRIIIPDNRGAGQTDAPPADYTIEQMTADIAALCQTIGIKHAHFVGNSMGGFIVQQLAYQHPKLTRSIVISNSTTTAQCNFQLYLEAQLELLKANAPLEPIIKSSCSWVYSFNFLTQSNALNKIIQLTLNNPFPFTVAGYAGQYAAVRDFDSSTWVNQIKVPTLVIGSDQDLIFNERSVRLLADLIPNAKYHHVHNCGHLPFIEQPELFAQIIKNHTRQ